MNPARAGSAEPAALATLSPQSFRAITDLFHEVSGIRLSPAKHALVGGRLQRLAQERGLSDLDRYVDQVLSERDPAEIRRVVDKLTTNETYFFREPEHFEHLAALARRRPAQRPLRVWSAASSSGEEGYTIAMVLAEALGPSGWEVVGTDLSSAMVESARRAVYPLERARHVPPPLLRRWCLRGTGPYDGQLLIARELRDRVHFRLGNLTQAMPDLGRFDVIFLRNVLIYFDPAGKVDVVRRVLGHLEPDGVLFTGHAESINNLGLPLVVQASAVYGRA